VGYFIFVALIVLAAAAVAIGGRIAHSENPTGNGHLISGLALVIGLVLLVVVTGFESVTTIDPGHIGIKKSFGKLVGTTGNGWVTHSPWTSVASLSVQNTLREYDMTGSNSAVTADSQPVFMTVQVNYQVDRNKAVNLYQSTGGDFVNRVLDPNVYQLTKAVTANYTATQFAQNRDTIRARIEKALSRAVKPQGIQINNVSLKNVQFTTALQAAIERTVEATQNAKREQAQVQVVQAEAQQRVAEAKGKAEATIAEARAAAEAQHLQNKTLTPLLVQKEAIDKLNPNVQVIVCAQGKVCVPQAVVATAGSK
jgi:regulator of protease activity HflC (stomatin/prohibitin superfamily)